MSEPRTLTFRDIERNQDGSIDFEYRSGSVSEHLWFRLPSGIRPHPDLIACAIASIFNGSAEQFDFLEPITAETRARLQVATGATWNAPLLPGEPPRSGSQVALSFSGGLDSLAALALLDDDARLVSIDFGGGFSRERDFFETFPTAIVETNVRGFEKSWTFMGLAAILMKEELEAGYLAFGSILEASPWNFLPGAMPSASHSIFKAAGYEGIAPVAGLTEFATTAVAAKRYPELMHAALTSLADTHTEKWFRKLVMLEAIDQRYSLGLDLPEDEDLKRQPLTFGNSFAIDFLAPGMLKFAKEGKFDGWMAATKGLSSFVSKRDLEFYFRENTSLGLYADDKLRLQMATAKAKLDVLPYRHSDWDEIRDLVSVLKFFHVFPGDTW